MFKLSVSDAFNCRIQKNLQTAAPSSNRYSTMYHPTLAFTGLAQVVSTEMLIFITYCMHELNSLLLPYLRKTAKISHHKGYTWEN